MAQTGFGPKFKEKPFASNQQCFANESIRIQVVQILQKLKKEPFASNQPYFANESIRFNSAYKQK